MKKSKIMIIAAALVILLGGATVLYKSLSGETGGPGLLTMAQDPSQSEGQSLPRTEAQSPTQTAAQTTEETEGETEKTTSSAATEQTRDPSIQLAPNFYFTDAGGNSCQLSDFRGKPVVLNFWASWCPPCKAEMPDFEAKYQELGERVQFIMLNLTDNQRETFRTASDFIKDMGYSFPVFFDLSQDGANRYKVYSIPCTFFIDAEGYLVANAMGSLNEAVLQQGIDMILAP